MLTLCDLVYGHVTTVRVFKAGSIELKIKKHSLQENLACMSHVSITILKNFKKNITKLFCYHVLFSTIGTFLVVALFSNDEGIFPPKQLCLIDFPSTSR